MTDVLALEVALAVVGHDGVEDIFQSTAAPFTLFVHEPLRELHVTAPIEAGGLVVVFPIHQRATAVKLVVELHSTSRTKRQLRCFVGRHIELGHQVRGLARGIQASGHANEVVCRQEVGIEQRTVDVT